MHLVSRNLFWGSDRIAKAGVSRSLLRPLRAGGESGFTRRDLRNTCGMVSCKCRQCLRCSFVSNRIGSQYSTIHMWRCSVIINLYPRKVPKWDARRQDPSYPLFWRS
jgi:hypothetical protein